MAALGQNISTKHLVYFSSMLNHRDHNPKHSLIHRRYQITDTQIIFSLPKRRSFLNYAFFQSKKLKLFLSFTVVMLGVDATKDHKKRKRETKK